MSKLLKMFGLVVLLCTAMMLGGCGGTDIATPVNPSVTSAPIASTIAGGVATTGASTVGVTPPAGTTGYLATAAVSIPPNTTITAFNANGTQQIMTAQPTMTFTAPADATATHSGTIGVPIPAGYVSVNNTAVAISISITGSASATFSNPITIRLPAPGKADGTMIRVYIVKDGTTVYQYLGSYPASGGFVVFTVNNFCWIVGDPVFNTATGGTGGAGGTL